MKKEWILDSSNTNEKSFVKKLLISRGIKKEEDIKEFLNPLEMELTSPNVFTDMEKTIKRLAQAIDNKEKIVIYGDFDADGVTSTSVLYKTFKHLGADFGYFIPDREAQGHGFDTKALVKLMTTVKPKVIISVDCGISDVDAVKFINSFKTIDVIITDHHEAPEVLPDAYSIINPKAPFSLFENLPAKKIEHLTYLAGCGVAFKIAQALLTYYNKSDFIYELLPLVAVGTIADVVPLLGENRYFVTKGLELISQGKHEGLKNLIESAGYNITKGISAETIAFGVAPRINASGRLDTVECALKVLISDNPQEVQMSIVTLNELNKVRQTLCAEVFAQADEMVKKEGNKDSAIVLFNEEWHIGIIGIVASKLVEKYYKPVFLMNYNKETNQYRCSARSIEGVPLYEVLKVNENLFDGFGGHAMAAGLSFDGEKTTFETVKKALNETVSDYTKGKNLKPFIKIDLLLDASDVTVNLIDEISQLEPFGASNPSPIFEINNLTVKQKRLMGSDNSHLRLILTSDTYEFTAVWWGKGDISLNSGDKLNLAFHPQINEFNGNTTVQLVIDDIHSDALIEEEPSKSIYKIFDNRTKTGILPNVNDYLKTTKLNVKVFAESKYIIDTLKSYHEISSRTFTREDIPTCDVIMFFDYPSDKKTLNKILEKAQPKGLHFMNFEPKLYDEKELLKTFSGMIKFASHNNGGKIELVRCASFLGKSTEVIEKLLELFEETNHIKILDKNNAFYIIEYLGGDLTEILNHPKYSQIIDMAEECDMFRTSLLEDDLEKILI
ncbi:single-stranded-DNA-specific exonuclease RecJ [bacterium]|nr:single-stranded-DNA-specific exonuclease RecJ [bacterium]